jgi:hypothetical protein
MDKSEINGGKNLGVQVDKISVLGIDEDSYLEYENPREFYNWILTLKSKNVRGVGISKRGQRNIK